MSDWQPARIKLALDSEHSEGEPDLLKKFEALGLAKKIVRVRIANMNQVILHHFPCMGEGVRIFELHPEDRLPGGGPFICEHEILTD